MRQRLSVKAQRFIIMAINRLGYNPFMKPVHRYTFEEYRAIGDLFDKAKEA